MKRVVIWIIQLCLMILGFVFVFDLSTLIGLGKNFITLQFAPFWQYFSYDLQQLLQVFDISQTEVLKEFQLGKSYGYSMTIFGASLLVVVILGTILAMVVMMTPKVISNQVKRVINFFEGVPDLLIIFLFQFTVITLYQSTGIKLLQLYGIFGHKPYFIPIVTVSFLPTLLLTQFLINILEDEESKIYVEYCRAKGLGKIRILMVHMLKNIYPLFILQLRTSIWIILSTIYLLEYMFNIQGFTYVLNVLILRNELVSLVLCLILFILPLLLMEAVGFFISKKVSGEESVSL